MEGFTKQFDETSEIGEISKFHALIIYICNI